jgi:PAS domain S-box-containing protein
MKNGRNRFPWSLTNLNFSWREVILVCFVAILSYGAAKLGGSLIIGQQAEWPLWLGNAFLASILLLVPRRMWPVLIPTALSASFLYNVQSGLTIRLSALLIFSDTVEVLAAALCLSYAFGGVPRLNNVRALAKFSLLAVILPPFIGAFFVALAAKRNYWMSWRIYFFSEAIVYLTLMPAIIGWFSKGPTPRQKSRAYYLEAAGLIAGLLAFAYLTFDAPWRYSTEALLYSLVPFMLWSALRFGSTGVSTSAIAIAVLALWGAAHNRGPFIESQLLKDALSLQLFLFFTTAPFMVLAAVVTERKSAEEALRQSEQRWRTAFENSAISIMMRNLEGRYIATNRVFQNMLGYTESELCQLNFMDVTYEEDRKADLELTAEILEGKRQHYEIEKRYRRKDGALFWVRNNVALVPGMRDVAPFLFAVVEDITQRKQEESARRYSEERYRVVVETANDAVVSADESGAIQFANPATLRVFGYEPEELIGKPLTVLMPEFLRKLHENGFRRYLTTGQRHVNWQGNEFTGLRKNGEEFPVEVSFGELTMNGHRVFTGFIRDIGERKQAEEQREKLRRAQADLAHINRVTTMGELAASLGHEIKQPISAAAADAETCLQWLSRDQPDLAEAQAAASRLIKDVTRASDIITRIGSLFKKGVPQRELVQIDRLIDEMVSLIRSEAVRYSISIHSELAKGLPKIMADRVGLQQVFMNLMLNGIDAMKDMGTAGRLTITARQSENRQLIVSVSDTGVGLRPEQNDQIFNVFFTSKPQGTGMGLPISRSIIESHGGRLWATSGNGPGATFQFTLPIEDGEH